jgi:uncharacterized protein DUF3352
MDGQQADRSAVASCPSCGAPLSADATMCASCGRAVARPAASVSAQTTVTATPLSEPSDDLETTWPSAVPVGRGALAGMASLAATPVAPPVSRRPRRGLLATIAAICLVALVSGGTYWVFASFIHTTSQTDTARYVPDTAAFYASVDLVGASANSHHFNVNDALSQDSVARPMKQAIGLDWKSDIQPWVGRMVSVAAFPSLTGDAAGGKMGGMPLALAVILQSRDDGAATRALDKALAARQPNNYAHGSYGNFTQRTAPGDAATFEIGSGLVIYSNTLSGAHMVVDRANGQGANLAGNSDFIHATAALPSDRYGTFYVGVSALTDPLGTGGSGLHIPFLDTYPTIAGSVAWTSDGVRTVANLKPVRSGVPSVPLNGDTTGLAALVPGNAPVYIGAATAGPLAGEFARLIATGPNSPDPVRSALGVEASDPVLSQPAAFYFVESTGLVRQRGGLLLRAPNVGAVNAMLAKAAAQNKWTTRAISVNGVAATEYDTAATAYEKSHAAAVSLFVQGTLVLVDSADTAQAVLATASGATPSLAHSASFQRLTAHAPSSHAVTMYTDTHMLTNLFNIRSVGAAPVASTPTLGQTVSASLLTIEWTTDQLRLTGDALYTN